MILFVCYFVISIGNLFVNIVCFFFHVASTDLLLAKALTQNSYICQNLWKVLFFVCTCWWVRGGIAEAIVLKYITDSCSSAILILFKQFKIKNTKKKTIQLLQQLHWWSPLHPPTTPPPPNHQWGCTHTLKVRILISIPSHFKKLPPPSIYTFVG